MNEYILNLLIDFFAKRTQNWWERWIKNFRAINLTFDGLWLDMNEPGKCLVLVFGLSLY